MKEQLIQIIVRAIQVSTIALPIVSLLWALQMGIHLLSSEQYLAMAAMLIFAASTTQLYKAVN